MSRRTQQPHLDTDAYVRRQLGDEGAAGARRERTKDRTGRQRDKHLVIRQNGEVVAVDPKTIDFAFDGLTVDGGVVTVPSYGLFSGGTPTLTLQGAAGSTASTAGSAGNDRVGVIQLEPSGAGIGTGALMVLAFGENLGTSDYVVQLTARSSAARALGAAVGPTAHTGAGWTLTTDTAPTPGQIYQWSYTVERF